MGAGVDAVVLHGDGVGGACGVFGAGPGAAGEVLEIAYEFAVNGVVCGADTAYCGGDSGSGCHDGLGRFALVDGWFGFAEGDAHKDHAEGGDDEEAA